MLALHQPYLHTLPHDLFEQLLEQLRFLKPSVSVLGERGVVGNLLIEAEAGEPAPRQMHTQFFHQLALTRNAIQVANQQYAQQQLGIDRRSTGFAVAVLQLLSYKFKTDVLVDQPP